MTVKLDYARRQIENKSWSFNETGAVCLGAGIASLSLGIYLLTLGHNAIEWSRKHGNGNNWDAAGAVLYGLIFEVIQLSILFFVLWQWSRPQNPWPKWLAITNILLAAISPLLPIALYAV